MKLVEHHSCRTTGRGYDEATETAMRAHRIWLVIGFLVISLYSLFLIPATLDFREWFIDEPRRAQTLLTCIALGIAMIGIWLGRKCLLLTGPCVLIFLLLAAIGIPGAIPARNEAQRAACINNLKFIANAKSEWAKDKHKLPTDIPTGDDLYGTNKFLRHTPACPRGGKYRIGAVNENPTCSFADKGHKVNAQP